MRTKRIAILMAIAALAFPAIALAFNDGDQVHVNADGRVIGRLADGRYVVRVDSGLILAPATDLSAVATPTPSPSPTATPTATPTDTPTPTPTAIPTATSTPTPVPGTEQFPNESTTGTPPLWAPLTTRSTDMTVNTAGAVVQDVRFTNGARLNINAQNVTVRRVEFQGGWIVTDQAGVVIEDSTFDRRAPETNGGEGAISYCGYTARRVAILDRNEGFRDGCSTPTHIEDSYARITPPDNCGDWHGDGIQGYTGGDLFVDNVTIDFRETAACPGNAPFFFPGGQGNSAAFVNGLLVRGGGFSFRMGTPGSVQDLRIAQGTWPAGWHYGPVSVTGDKGSCLAINPWEAKIVNADSNWQVTSVIRSVACS